MQPGKVAASFTLTERSGKPFDSASLRGKVWLASVFFANCPGPCFRENQAVADILRNIPDPDFMAVSVTCDPENDTPESLRRYADRFEADPARWKFLTGDMATIKEIANGTFLAGITRSRHMENLRANGVEVREVVMSFDDVTAADEVFLSGNFSKVMPVTAFEDRQYQVGPVTKRVRQLYWDWARSAA
jgi:cytochrome oxidase Cu insertion factor (SCO1/SenC/PrrC family)